jgi:nucleoid-associated protein YgaU
MQKRMTRENKLALVVGFGLILFVGILISDHFSAARNQEAANLASGEVAMKAVKSDPGLIDVAQHDGLRPGMEATRVDRVPNQPTGPEAPNAGAPVPTLGDVHEPQAPPSGAEPLPMIPGSDEVRIADQHQDAPVFNMPRYPEIDRTAQASTGAGADPAPLPGERSHQIGKGDTLFAIAKRYYGDASLWKKLQAFNQDRISAVDGMRPGVALRIPPKEALTGEAPAKTLQADSGAAPKASPPSVGTPQPFKPKANELAMNDTTRSKPVGSKGAITKTMVTPIDDAPTPRKPEASKGVEKKKTDDRKAESSAANASKTKAYTVRNGDTMSKIAARVMGSSARWHELYELNRDVIKDPHAVKPGTVIKVPSGRLASAE